MKKNWGRLAAVSILLVLMVALLPSAAQARVCRCEGGRYRNGTPIPASRTYDGFVVIGMDGKCWTCSCSSWFSGWRHCHVCRYGGQLYQIRSSVNVTNSRTGHRYSLIGGQMCITSRWGFYGVGFSGYIDRAYRQWRYFTRAYTLKMNPKIYHRY